jgi:hypothetical protein
MGKKIKLYHGSIHEFDAIDVSKGMPFKDFGIGFYLSANRRHAVNLALRNKRIELERGKSQRRGNSPVNAWVYRYELDLDSLRVLKVKDFSRADGEWVRFVIANRNSGGRLHDYDVVTGPTADDDTKASLQLYFMGAFGHISEDRAIGILLELIEPYRLPPQYFFGTQRAADQLLFRERTVVG